VPMRLLQSSGIRVSDFYEAIVPHHAESSDHNLPLLERFGHDLSARARDGELMPVIGRATEIQTVAEILLRKRKNNPVLVGEAGVGKTAVVEGLASALLETDDQHPLKHARIIELAVASVVAGTKYRGE